VDEDKAEAVQLFWKAAEQDDAVAQWRRGCCFEDGKSVIEDKVEAVQWFQKAAEQDDADRRAAEAWILL
jgi:TPR repeat protein